MILWPFEYWFHMPRHLPAVKVPVPKDVNDPEKSIHMEIQISKDDPEFNNENIVAESYTGTNPEEWKLWTGLYWSPYPEEGADAGYHGNMSMFMPGEGVLEYGIRYYLRFRAYNGVAWSDYRGDVV